jgi:hypothetical protein
MNAKQRAFRNRTREQRTTRRAIKAVATNTPQTARTHLVAAGINDATAKRYAGAFSRGTTPTTQAQTEVKLRGRRTKTITVKLYDRTAFTARFRTYRPKDADAAALFNRLALAA